jgi:hypothetical protein
MTTVRAVGRAVLWLLLGLVGSLAILVAATDAMDRRGYPQLQSGRVFTDLWDRGYVSAVGTWVFEDDTKQAFPRQTTDIKCYRETKECQSAQADIAFDILTVQTETFPITSWDSQSIVYVSNDPMCVTYTYTISRSTNRVTGRRQPKPSSSSTESACEPFEKRTFNLSLRDGFLVWQQLKRDEERIVLPIMYGALGVWWAFIVYRIVRTIRRRATPVAHITA